MKEESLKELDEVLARCEDKELIADFLGALLTPHELGEVTSRWALVRLIDEKMSQREIAERLGMSLCKITRGSREYQKTDSPFRKMIDLYKK